MAILFSIILCLCLLSKASGIVNAQSDGNSRKNRTDYLKSIGCYVKSETETKKNVTIPYDFSDVYRNYNDIQKQAGYDLSGYKGCKCVIYSYDVDSFADIEDTRYFKANIIVYKGRIIGGDISSVEIDGEMYPLKKRNEETKIRQVYFQSA